MRIGVVGINHKLADLKLREKFAKICHELFGSLKATHLNHSLVLLITCNRVEIYFSSNDLANAHSYILNTLRFGLGDGDLQKFYTYFEHNCFEHLARVTAGLDSAIVAETEIQGQVKAAYEHALKHFTLPFELHYLFQKCLKIGKQIRKNLPLCRGLPDLEDAILNAGKGLFETLQEAKILFVGASEINRKILHCFKKRQFKNMTICNRTKEAADAIAQKFHISCINWSLLPTWSNFDLIIFGTKSREPIIMHPLLTDRRKKLIIDLSVPRNVDAKLARHPQITLLNIDQINRKLRERQKRLHGTLLQAEESVHDLTKNHIQLFSFKERKRGRFLQAS